ncbi:MAG: hypothetical protein WCY70_04205 [Methanoculleus sp.]
MKENLRRPLLFLITVGIGIVIIAFDATAEIIIAGTVLAGFLALVVTGALDLAELRPSRLRAALRERKEEKKAAPPDAPAESPPPAAKRPLSGVDISGMFGTLRTSIMEAIAHARASESEKKSSIEKIDAVLDQAVEGTVPEPSITPAPPKAGGGAADPLASLADLDVDSLEGLDIDGDASGSGAMFDPDQISLLSAEDEDTISNILKSHQDELDDFDLPASIDLAGDADDAFPPAVADIPELPGDGGMPDMSTLSDELSMLNDLDLDEIEIEGEEEEEIDADEPPPEEDLLEEIEEEAKEDFDMVSFAAGGAIEDDLISSLKADSKKKKFVEDISLIRELKGEKYPAKDLAVELEDILATMETQR